MWKFSLKVGKSWGLCCLYPNQIFLTISLHVQNYFLVTVSLFPFCFLQLSWRIFRYFQNSGLHHQGGFWGRPHLCLHPQAVWCSWSRSLKWVGAEDQASTTQLLRAPFSPAPPGWVPTKTTCTKSAGGQHLSSWACLTEAQPSSLRPVCSTNLSGLYLGKGMIISWFGVNCNN